MVIDLLQSAEEIEAVPPYLKNLPPVLPPLGLSVCSLSHSLANSLLFFFVPPGAQLQRSQDLSTCWRLFLCSAALWICSRRSSIHFADDFRNFGRVLIYPNYLEQHLPFSPTIDLFGNLSGYHNRARGLHLWFRWKCPAFKQRPPLCSHRSYRRFWMHYCSLLFGSIW